MIIDPFKNQPVSINDAPIQDPLINPDGTLTYPWMGWVTNLVDTISQIITQTGIFIPSLPTDEINYLISQNVIQNGYIVYNNETNEFKGYENGVLKTFTLV